MYVLKIFITGGVCLFRRASLPEEPLRLGEIVV